MPVPAADDAQLGERVRAGDDEAFALIYERHAPALFDFVARTVHDAAAAEDIVQSAFVRAYEGRGTLRDPAKVRSWLFTTAYHLALNHLGRGRPAENVDDRWDLADPARGPEPEALARDAARLVWDAAASLEPRQYAVLDMSLRREMATAEIAEVLGVPGGHAAVLLNRAREALGNAVRYLLVARRRTHCERLAALVPENVRALTAEQRTSVDHHMRQCEECRRMARRLTAPAELLGGLAAVPLPPSLSRWGAGHGWAAGHAQLAVRPPGPASLARRASLPHVNAAVGLGAAAAVAAGIVGVSVIATRGHATPIPPVVVTSSARPVACGPATTSRSAQLDAVAWLATVYPASGGVTLSWTFDDAATTWDTAATLHVLHATPGPGATGSTGTWYLFYVDGCRVGQQAFLADHAARRIDATAFAVTYAAYRSGDPEAAPSGGTATVEFRWDGRQLTPAAHVAGALPGP